MSVTQVHEQTETLTVDVNIPGHEERTTTALFRNSKKALVLRESGRCFICGCNAEETGHPMEAHHHPIERSMANMIDWELVKPFFPHFDWSSFDPADPYTFVDDMTVNGLLLCKAHHTGKDEGIHDMPYPLWIAQKFGREGYQFSPIEAIHHEAV
jgi:hypothetical protein